MLSKEISDRLRLSRKESFLIKNWGKFIGCDVYKHYMHFANHFVLTPDKIKEIQSQKLSKLLNHAFNYVPFYKSKLSSFSNNIDDWPVLTRDQLSNQLISNRSLKNNLFKSTSSGSTGTPVTYYKDNNAKAADIASGMVLQKICGLKLDHPRIHIWGNSSSIRSWKTVRSRIKQRLLNQYNYSSIKANQDPALLSEFISKKRIKYIDGYATSIIAFAKYLGSENKSLENIKRTITTAENLNFNDALLVEKFISPVSNLYGCGEVNGIAIKMDINDYFYVLDTHVYIEVVPTELPEVYSILVTDLDNFAFPLIRYKVGDLSSELNAPNQNKSLPFSNFKEIYGRDSDVLNLDNGKQFMPITLFGGTVFRKFNEVIKHKVEFENNELTFIFEVQNISDDLYFRINEEIKNLANSFHNLSYRILFVDKIPPSNSGKYKYFENLDKPKG